MTRRLRYSSNLDESYLAQRAIAAAHAACDGDNDAARQALQDCFDLVAQERDHYFTGNPFLIDLTLVVPDAPAQGLQAALADADPINLLIAADTLERLAAAAPQLVADFRQRLDAGTADFAGGWFDRPFDRWGDFHRSSAADVLAGLDRANEIYLRHLGRPARHFARLGGGVPPDLLGPLIERGYRGAIIADFLGGRDSGQHEPKLIWQAGQLKLDAITARPLDAAKATDVLEVAARVGEAMDAGHAPTALLAHWPNQTCVAYHDLRQATRWGLSLGKFVTLHQYFEQSARSFHTFKPSDARPDWSWLRPATTTDNTGANAPADGIGGTSGSPLDRARLDFLASHQRQSTRITDALLGWALNRDLPPASERHTAASAKPATGATLPTLVNPHVITQRATTRMNDWPACDTPAGKASAAKESSAKSVTPIIDAVRLSGAPVEARIETPGLGFTALAHGSRPGRSWWKPTPKLAIQQTLRNGSMAVNIDPEKGSIAGVYRTGIRGNRLSTRIATYCADDKAKPYAMMQVTKLAVGRSDPLVGEINVQGTCSRNKQVEARFDITYRIEAGSRLLHVLGEVEALFKPADDPFRHYIALRTAVTDPTVIPQLLVRDRRLSASGRRYAAPLGLHLDLASHSITICSGGSVAHRRPEDTVFDTLLAVDPGKHKFHLAYGIDLQQPLHQARNFIASSVAYDLPLGLRGTGYFLHAAPSSLVLIDAVRLPDDPRTIELSFVETEGRSRQAKVTSSLPLASAARHRGDQATPEPLAVEKDAVTFEIGAHGIAQIRLTRQSN